MCGRFVMFTVAEEFTSTMETKPTLAPMNVDGSLPQARYNIAPTQPVVAIARGENADGSVAPGSVAAAVRWGLVPHWAREMPRTPYFNARAETWRQKPTFRNAKPCVIPMNGWYEWKNKQPQFIYYPDSSGNPQLFTVAGLWERCGNLVSCTIVTTESRGQLTEVHHRMPRVLHDADIPAWLDQSEWAEEGEVGLTDDGLIEYLAIRPANKLVGNTANDGEHLLHI